MTNATLVFIGSKAATQTLAARIDTDYDLAFTVAYRQGKIWRASVITIDTRHAPSRQAVADIAATLGLTALE